MNEKIVYWRKNIFIVPSGRGGKKFTNEIRLINLWTEDSPLESIALKSIYHSVKSVRIRSYFGPYFPAFGLNMEGYGVSLHIQSECGKMGTRITPNTDTFHAVHVISALLLQKTKAKDHAVILERRLELWENGNVIELLNKGESIQERLPTAERSIDIAKVSAKCKNTDAKRQRKWSIKTFN